MTTARSSSEDENAASHTSGMSDIKNNVVAEGDLHQALRGIENCLRELKKDVNAAKPAKSTQEEGVNQAGSPTGVAEVQYSEEYCEQLEKLLSGMETSLSNDIKRLVQPVSDEEYFSYARRNVMDQDKEEESSDEESVEEWQNEFDEETEVKDKQSIEHAKVLRSKVRDTAARVKALRAAVTETTVSITKEEVELLVGPQLPVEDTFEPDQFEPKFRQLEVTDENAKSEKLVEMEKQLASCLSSLHKMKNDIPESMENLQETVQTIEESIARQKGGEEQLSQTERAIISRENEGARRSAVAADTESFEPAKRLGLFLGEN